MRKKAIENTAAGNMPAKKRQRELYVCPSCGYMFPMTMETCPVCGAESKGAATAPSRLVKPQTVSARPRPGIPRDSVILTIIGRGMMPYVNDGESVYIKRTDHIDVGDIGVLFLDDDRMVIRYLSEDGLCSLSPQWEAFHVDPHAHYEVWGKVVGVVQPGDILDDKPSEDTARPAETQASTDAALEADAPKPDAIVPRRRRRRSAKSTAPFCSFCGKPQDDVEKLIVGKNNICICDECVRSCDKLLDAQMG